MKKFSVVIFVLLSFTAHAGCWYDGKEYPVGHIIDGYICHSDGYWRKLE